MIFTDQNNKNTEFDETKTFDVNTHTASTVNRPINRVSDVKRGAYDHAQNVPSTYPVDQQANGMRRHGGALNEIGSKAAEQINYRPSNNGRPAQGAIGNIPKNRPQTQYRAEQNPTRIDRTGYPRQTMQPRPDRGATASYIGANANEQTGRIHSSGEHAAMQRGVSQNGNFEAGRQVTRHPVTQRPVTQQEKTNFGGRADDVQGKKNIMQHRTVSRDGCAGSGVSSMMKTKYNSSSFSYENEKKIFSKPKKDKEGIGGEGNNTVMGIVKTVLYIVFVLVASIFLSVFIILVGNDVFAFVKSDEIVEVTIPEYATLDDVAQILHKEDVIKYPNIFKIYAHINHDNGEYLAGTYSVSPMENYDSLLSDFKYKEETGTKEIRIQEGYTTDEIIDLFVSEGIGTREGFIDVIENYDFDYWFVRDLEANGIPEGRIYRLDGYLFPDTYEFYVNSSEYTVINKLLKRFGQIFTSEYRKQCEEFGYTVDEVVTLASLIEKEAGSPSEFFTVSSVFHNRLNNPTYFPRLESDATIVYAIQHETGTRPTLKASDLEYDTPYNTYKYKGFPPGPIANPSASAILAALSPTDTNYYYFVANNGTTYFSATKAEHDAYIAQFRTEESVQQTTGDTPISSNP